MSNKANPNFIGEYKKALSKDECKLIIQFYEESKDKEPGILFDMDTNKPVVDKTRKDSTDLMLGWEDEVLPSYILDNPLFKYAQQYRAEYPCCDEISPWGPDELYNIQKYKPNQGFHKVHCESGNKNNPRVLAWMFYLNTVTDGGGTRFPAYDLDVQAEVGKLLIWPAYFTHIHHGIVSETQTKYIATGWFVYAD
ncbi:MAG: 2OG-Fe(II) oxygenase [Candidatus Nanopelagicaceae bacterium]